MTAVDMAADLLRKQVGVAEVMDRTGLTRVQVDGVVAAMKRGRPAAAPAAAAAAAGTRCGRCEDVDELLAQDVSWELIAERLDVAEDTLRRDRERHRAGGCPVDRAPKTLTEWAHRLDRRAGQEDLPVKARRLLARAVDLLVQAQAEVDADAGKAALRRAVAAKQAELEALKAQLRGGKANGKPAAAGRDRAAIRRWAAAEGVQVAPRGRIPESVLVAYDRVHPAAT